MPGIFVTGTDTEVGKTYISRLLLAGLRARGLQFGVMKPVSAGGQEDAIALMAASSIEDPIDLVNPVALNEPLSPNLAAERAGATIGLEEILSAFTILSERHDRLLVEGAGGILVPLSDQLSMADLASQLDLPVLIVSRPALGTINHTLLTIEACKSRNLPLLGIVYSHSSIPVGDPSETESPGIISRLSGVPSLGILPHITDPEPDLELAETHLDLTTIIKAV